jgi:hypothetical protein
VLTLGEPLGNDGELGRAIENVTAKLVAGLGLARQAAGAVTSMTTGLRK